jgi:hypothetical protein
MPLPLIPQQSSRQVAPKVRIDSVYLKPLARDFADLVDPMVALRKLKAEMLKRMRKGLTQETFSEAAKKALSQALTIKVGASSLIIIAKHPAWKPLVEGQRSGSMMWLAKAKHPIPIITESGKVIFRSATAKSLANGKWVHPGRQKSHFYDRAREEAREFMKKHLAGQIRRQLAQALR